MRRLPDEPTTRFYADHARELAEELSGGSSPLVRFFVVAFPRGARVVDVGAAVGRDVGALLDQGYDAFGVEPAQALRDIAHADARLVGRIHDGELPERLPRDLSGFDGLVCSAVLQHLPRGELFASVLRLRDLLTDHGRALVSVPSIRADVVDGRDARGRHFNGVLPEELALLFERVGFQLIGRWDADDSRGRPGIGWAVLLLERRDADVRPLDLLDSVLGAGERKTATYKFALVRALAELASTRPHLGRFRSDGRVEVPLDAVAERWIDYYWPIFEADRVLPQISAKTRLGFASELEQLIAAYRSTRRGLSGFVTDRRSERLDPGADRAARALFRKLRRVIVEGPVRHAGGGFDTKQRSSGLTTRRGTLFEHAGDSIVIAGSVWRDLVLLGPWVADAVVLRWAQHVAELGGQSGLRGAMIECLLPKPDPERDTADVRKLVLSEAHVERLRCVWSHRPVRPETLAIDHILPYALWRNNDLWNLVPTHRTTNGEKSDRLPPRDLLRARSTEIRTWWDRYEATYPERFASEARLQTGLATPSQPELFEVLVEAVETTRVQRRAEEWTPSART